MRTPEDIAHYAARQMYRGVGLAEVLVEWEAEVRADERGRCARVHNTLTDDDLCPTSPGGVVPRYPYVPERETCDHAATLTTRIYACRPDGTVVGQSDRPVTICVTCRAVTKGDPCD